MLCHDVFFTLKDKSPEAQAKLIAACKHYLPYHSGITYFSVGTLAEELKREVNDLDFQVALHIVFADQKSHDEYQVADVHNKFVAENKDSWAKVRVFDSIVETIPPQK